MSTAQHILTINHIPESDPPQFRVVRPDPYKAAEPVTIPDPYAYPVQGRQEPLMQQLRWYLEKFLDYPYFPETEHAERVLKALDGWGEEAFNSLFGTRPASGFFDKATDDGHKNLQLQIESSDPRILAWPWEGLYEPETGQLAHTCQISRRIDKVRDPVPLAESLPKDQVRILLVVCRPYENDVGYRSVAKSLVNLIHDEDLPAHVDVLRPPTFDQLRAHLDAHPGEYHIVHFDGHGSYGRSVQQENNRYTLLAAEGRLIFETGDGKPHPVTAEDLALLLREYNVPAVVLNACQSAMIDETADDPFASVAAGLLRGGVRSVTAMAYSLYVSGAQQFVPAYYKTLFRRGQTAESVRAGRQQLRAQKGRVCARGTHDLEDWLLPVVYEQQPLGFEFANQVTDFERKRVDLPAGASDENNPYGLIGRDGAILDLERALHRRTPAVLIQGLGGVGKTTLAKGFLRWLQRTSGLDGAFWFFFAEIRSAESVVNQMGMQLYGTNFGAAPLDKRIEALAEVFAQNRFLIVWDNFESVAGIAGTSVKPNLSEADQELLVRFLRAIDGAKSKVLITSRSTEEWIPWDLRARVDLRGLDGEERWEFCTEIVRGLGKSIDREDEHLVELMKLLGGHPLAMRVILPKLEDRPASQVAQEVIGNLADVREARTEAERHLFATLQFVEQSLDAELRPLLVPLALYEGYAQADMLEAMAQQAEPTISRNTIDRFFRALAAAGLVRDVAQGVIFELLPALTGYLRPNVLAKAQADGREAWTRAFVDLMGRLADAYTAKELHEQRPVFHLHGANFHFALGEAKRLEMAADVGAVTQALARFAQHSRDFVEARNLFEAQAEFELETRGEEYAAAPYHQLGRIAQEQRDFAAAEAWYRKSLDIKEKLGNEHGAAITYHQLGMIAQEQRDFAAAEAWYRKSLGAFEKLGDEHHAAAGYHQLGRIAEEQRDFAAAEAWYRKSLAIKEKLGNEHGAASTYHQLGTIAQEQRDFAAAEAWYRKSLAIKEKLGNEHVAAITYHQLGVIAQEQRDFAAAEAWYRKSLAITDKLGSEHVAASTYAQLGLLSESAGDHSAAADWLLRATGNFARASDPHTAARARSDFLRNYQACDDATQGRLRGAWVEAGLGEFPEDAGAAGA